MDRNEIELLLKAVIDKKKTLNEALSMLNGEPEFSEACSVAKNNVNPSYDSGDMDLGDAWAKLLRDTKLHAIEHLSDTDTMKFISNSIY